jgi:phosphatidate cytidylyltransferase
MYYLRPELVAKSGFPRKDYPLFHEIMYDRNWSIFLTAMCCIWVVFAVSLRRSSLKYQFSNLAAAINLSVLFTFAAQGAISCYLFGCFWAVFVILGVACNDNFAYFVGRAFGRTPLISLSPNKTLEGFLGGAFFTIIWTCINVRLAFTYDWLICTVDKVQFEPFAPVNCNEKINPAYGEYPIDLFGM